VLPGLVLAAAGAVAFSGKAIIVKLAYRHGVDAVTLIMFRMLFALPLFVALAWWASRGPPALTRQDKLAILGLGFSGYYLASFLDFAGLAYVTASFERLVLYLNPTIVLGLGWDERVRSRSSLRSVLLLRFCCEAAEGWTSVALSPDETRKSQWSGRMPDLTVNPPLLGRFDVISSTAVFVLSVASNIKTS
jgi:hypothetical protein